VHTFAGELVDVLRGDLAPVVAHVGAAEIIDDEEHKMGRRSRRDEGGGKGQRGQVEKHGAAHMADMF
jgi:hypothetical protein